MSLPAWIYARFSTLEQAKGHSLERQLKGGRALIEAKGWLYSPDRELVDEGRSAFHGANREAGAALHDFEIKAREGHFANGAVLVVESLDRLTRQGHEETVDLLRLLTRKAVLDFFGHDAVETVLAPDARELAARSEIAEIDRLIYLKQRRLANVTTVLLDTPLKAMIAEGAQLERDIEMLEASQKDAQRDLDVLLGEGVPANNLAAIQSVLDKADSDDAETRYLARVKIHTALKNLIEKLVIWPDGEVAIWFRNGEVLIFDNTGERSGGTDSYYSRD